MKPLLSGKLGNCHSGSQFLEAQRLGFSALISICDELEIVYANESESGFLNQMLVDVGLQK